jgi:hypothetical protein
MNKIAWFVSAVFIACAVAVSRDAVAGILPGYPAIQITPRTFTGGFIVAGDIDNIYGALEANNPNCVLTVPTPNPGGALQGYGNGSILLDGSSECAVLMSCSSPILASQQATAGYHPEPSLSSARKTSRP